MWNASDKRDDCRLADMRRALELRSRILYTIRQFFARRHFVEIETPVRIPAPALERHIDAVPSRDQFLRTSPEFHLKRFLAQGYDRIFEMGPCFRDGEMGDLHNPEYTMIEWYRRGTDYIGILRDMEALLPFVGKRVLGGTRVRFRATVIDLSPPWERVSVEDAFAAHAGWNPLERFDADRFDLDLVEKVEPALPRDRPVVLMDYPGEAGGFARRKPGARNAVERWELYLGGVELANAFSELTDPVEQRARLEECARERQRAGKPAYAVDEWFLAALEKGLPPSGGVALGVDRLAMILTDASSLDGVIPFRGDTV